MKKYLILGTVLALTAMLMFSCNKNRFDLDYLDSAQGSGQWKLPIGNLYITAEDLLTQLNKNEMITHDEAGNLLVRYSFPMENLIKGSSMLNIGTFNTETTTLFQKPVDFPSWGYIDTTIFCRQPISMSADSASIVSAVVKSGQLVMTPQTNFSTISEIRMSSPDIIMPNGDSLNTTESVVNLAGATIRIKDPMSVDADSTFIINYAIRCRMSDIPEDEYELTTIIGMTKIRLEELTGFINSYVYNHSQDSSFKLPLNKIEGQMTFVGAKVRVFEKNTFGELDAELSIDRAEFHGGTAAPSPVFPYYPYVLNLDESIEYKDITPTEQTFTIGVNSEYDHLRFDASFNLNPNRDNQPIRVNDTSSLSLKLDANIPMRFNSSGVYYQDTIALNLSLSKAPELLKEILLSIRFDSEMPFNLKAQFYTLDSITERITDSLVRQPLQISASTTGKPVRTDAEISVTEDRLKHMVDSKKLMMRFVIDTDNKEAVLTTKSGLGMMIKADVIYGGETSINN